MSNNIESMAEASGNAKMHTPEMALKDALKMVGKEGTFKNGTKLMVLALDDRSNNYDLSFIQAGMSSSECVALCEVAKTRFLSHMGYIIGDGDL